MKLFTILKGTGESLVGEDLYLGLNLWDLHYFIKDYIINHH